MGSSTSDSLGSRLLLMEGKRIASLANKGINPAANLNRAIELWRKAKQGFRKDTHDYAACLSNEAGARAHLAELGIEPTRNLETSLSLHVRARKEGLRKKTESYSINLMSEGNARLRLARMGVEPEKNLLRAIELHQLSRKEGFKANTVEYGKSLMNEGTARMSLAELGIDPIDNLQKSILLYAKSRRQGFSNSSVEDANSLINEGTARKKLAGFGVEPITNIRQSIILFRSARNIYLPDTTSYAKTFINEGNARAILAELCVAPSINLNKAIDLYQKARNTNSIKNTVLHARCLANEGTARISLARLGVDVTQNLLRSINLFEKAREEGLTKDTTEYAVAHLNEGSARLQLAKIGTEKENNAKKAESNFILAEEFFLKTNNSLNLITLYGKLGDLKYFEEKYDEAFTSLKKTIELIEDQRASIKILEFRKSYLETVVSVYKEMVFTCLSLKKMEEAFHFAESVKSRMFLDLVESERKTIKGPPDLLKEYYDNLKRIEQIEMAFLGKNMPPRMELSLRILKGKHEELLLSIKEYDPDYYNMRTAEAISVDEVKKILKGKTLLEYFIGEKIAVFVINSNFNVRIIDENEMDLWGKISRLRKSIDEMPNAQNKSIDEMLTYFHNLLIKPVRDFLGKEIVIVPHGILHLLPFQALKNEKYLIENFAVGFAQSASSLKYLRPSKSEGVLIVGNPTGDLHFAEKEATGIAEYFEVTPVLRSDAKKENIKSKAREKKILHFACHGKFDQINPDFSGIILNDGMLTTIDFMNMTLDAELVVLSGCETAVSRITYGDEIEGLIRAIHYGGSRFVIASLWNVDDESTFRLFNDFYKRTGDFFDRLRLAEISLKNQGYSFYHWAPFQIYGI